MPPSPSLYGQTSSLAQQAVRVRDALQQKIKPKDLPPNTIQDLTQLADSLSEVGRRLEKFEAEQKNMTALAEITRVVNSSLELDEVLRIVMDNIVRLTR